MKIEKNNSLNESMIKIEIQNPIDQFDKSEKMMQELYENAIKWREALYFGEYFRKINEINQDTNTAETAETAEAAKTAKALKYFIENPSALDFIQNSSIMSLDKDTEKALASLGIEAKTEEHDKVAYDEVATKKIKMIWHMTQIQIKNIKDLKKNPKKNLSDEHVRGKIILNTMKEIKIDEVTAEYDKISHDVEKDEQMSDYGLFFHLFISLECTLLTDVPEGKITMFDETIFIENLNAEQKSENQLNETIFIENPNAEQKRENQLFRLEILQFFTYFNMNLYNKSTDYINKRLEQFKNFLSYPNEEYTLIMIHRLISRATNNETNDEKLRKEINKLREATEKKDADYHLTLKIFSLALIKKSSWLTSWLNDNNKYNNFIQSILKGQKQETVKNSIEILKENIDESRGLKNLDTILEAYNSIKNTEQNQSLIIENENEVNKIIDNVKQKSDEMKETINNVEQNVSNNTKQLAKNLNDVVDNVENNIVNVLESVNTVVQANNQNNNSTNNGTNQNNNSTNEDTNQNANSTNDDNLVIQNNQNLEEKSMGNTPLIIGGGVVIVAILIFVVYYSSSSTQESKDYNNVLELSPISDETNH